MKKITVLLVFLISFLTLSAQTAYKKLGNWDTNGKPSYLELQNDQIEQELLNRITTSLPEQKKVTDKHPEYLADGVGTNIHITKEADVWVTFIAEGAGYKNILGFYTYQEGTVPQSINDIKSSMTIIFPNASAVNSGGSLIAGNKVKIGRFQPGTVIGWFVIADGFRNGQVTDGNWIVFSDKNLNPETNTKLKQHNVLLNNGNGKVVLGFEDIRRDNSSCDQDFNDVLFFITSNPVEAINTNDIAPLDPVGKADIQVLKSVDNNKPETGSEITYTIKAKNNGPEKATNLTLLDKLPAGVEFVSYTAGKGNYNNTTGIWTIGELAVGAEVTLTIKALVTAQPSAGGNTGAFSGLGIASTFDVFLFGNLTQPSSDTEGKIAAGGNITLESYTVAVEADEFKGDDVLIAGKNLNFTSGEIYNGNVVYGNWTNLPVSTVTIHDGGTIRKATPIDFTAASLYFNNLSTSLFSQTVNGTTVVEWSSLKLTGTNSGINIFKVSSAQLQSVQEIIIDCPVGSTAIVNFYDNTYFRFSGNIIVRNISNDHILFNVPNATSIKVESIDLSVSLLAPQADVDFPNGVQNGQLIAKSAAGRGQFNHQLFKGTLPSTNNENNVITNTAKLNSMDQKDENPGNDGSGTDIEVQKPSNADLAVVKTVDNASPKNNEFVTYTIVLSNNGTADATGIEVEDKLPVGLKNAEVLSVTGTYSIETGLWAVASLKKGESVALKIKASVDASLLSGTRTIVNNVEIKKSGIKDPVIENNKSKVDVVIAEETEMDIEVKKSVNYTSPMDSTRIKYTILVKNNGPAIAKDVKVVDLLNQALENSSSVAEKGSYNKTSGLWSVGTLEVNETAKLEISADVIFAKTTKGIILNTAYLESASPKDINKSNDTSKVTITVRQKPENQEVDLKIEKSVDNKTPQDGSTITYTIKVTNNGPNKATGVKVSDVLPEGLSNISVNPSQGTYTTADGLWIVGDLENDAVAYLRISAKVNAGAMARKSFDLGIASDFNAFILEDINQPTSDTEGRLAVGNNAYLGEKGYSVGDKLKNSNGTVDVLVVGKKLQYGSGRVYNGNVVYGTTSNLPSTSVTVTEGTVSKGYPVDFEQASAYLKNLSADLGNRETNGETKYETGGVYCNGKDPYINIFDVLGSELEKVSAMQIAVPNGAVVIVNFRGENIDWKGGLDVYGTSKNNVIYNFPESKTAFIKWIEVTGSILAPNTDITFPSGLVSGQFIAKSLTGGVQINDWKFVGNIPGARTLVNVAVLSGCDQKEMNNTNNSSGVTVTLGGQFGNGNDGGSGTATGSTSGKWESVADFAAGQIIWTMSSDKEGRPMAGTWGGNIYRLENNSWTKINDGMGVAYVWSVVTEKSSGKIFAGTEKGVFVSEDGQNWIQYGEELKDKDVRALIFKDGVLYAGTWGYGMYKYNNGWVLVNEGMTENCAIHTLAVNKNNELLAGTFNFGVMKLNSSNVWERLSLKYDFIWALGVTDNGNIYAATYGDGIYVSTDNGANWDEVNTGVIGKYIYGVTIDGNDVNISTWEGGVYRLNRGLGKSISTYAGGSWQQIGLGGEGVSALFVGGSNGELLAGTKSGKIFRFIPETTANENETGIPAKFELGQNYPNPFNPATKINFTLAEAGNVKITVYNVLGQEVKTLVEGYYEAGSHTTEFDGAGLASGMYVYVIKTEKFSDVKKMMLLK